MGLMRTFLLIFCAALSLHAESAAGLKWTAPAGWKSEGQRPMRAATYTVAPDTECAVYFFGAGQGGGIEANVDRWKGQFQGPGGGPATAKTAKRTIHGLPVTTIDVSGSYSGMGGPMAAQSGPKPGFRLLGAIVEGAGGKVFVKFTGPAKAVEANQAKFEQMLASFEKER
jgi:hypothetical protein